VAAGVLHSECVSIFSKKSAQGGEGEPLRLHLHQSQAVRAARTRTNYVLTTGTGSGKSLAYIVPIVDHVLRSGSRKGVRARAAAIFMRFSAVRFRSPRSIPP
jgi:ATP-dependent helicase YprA (DUF1998 family)